MSDPLREAALECLDAAVAWRVRATPENTERLTRAETALMRAALAPSPETPGPVEALTWALDYIRRHGGVDNDYHDIERAAFADAVLAATKEPTP